VGEHAALCPHGLAGRVDDHARELIGVVRRGKHLPEAGDRLAQALALRLELAHASLEPSLRVVRVNMPLQVSCRRLEAGA